MSERELYRDVLDEGAADFEEAVLQKAVRARRRARRTRAAGRSAVIAMIAAYAGWQFWPREELIATPPGSTEAIAVLPSHTVLRSQPFAGVIRTAANPVERLVLTSGSNVVVIRTGEAAAGQVRALNDEQLLSFFKGQAVALVGRGRGHAELVFVESPGQ